MLSVFQDTSANIHEAVEDSFSGWSTDYRNYCSLTLPCWRVQGNRFKGTTEGQKYSDCWPQQLNTFNDRIIFLHPTYEHNSLYYYEYN